MTTVNGGAIVAEVFVSQGVKHLFTLCGGHISPILVESKARGIHVVDMRDEKNTVFAADATSRMTGIPGVAAVTAGPGVTNAITAVKNAQMAQSPLILIGGAAATVLKGRGALQDVDQLSLMAPITKWATSVSRLSQLGPTMERAFEIARSGTPGPVFVEIPIDLLYPEALVKTWYLKDAGVENPKTLSGKALKLYLEGHLYRQFHTPPVPVLPQLPELTEVAASFPPAISVAAQIKKAASALKKAKRPVLLIGSQALVNGTDTARLAQAVEKLGVPTFLGGMARGLLGRRHSLQFRHARGKALKEADVVVVAGFPFDFRLSYGRAIGSKAYLIAANLSARDLVKNRRPQLPVHLHPGDFLMRVAENFSTPGEWSEWFSSMQKRENQRDEEIQSQASASGSRVNPLHFFTRLEEKMAEDAILVVDGGDFVGTASYILRPRAPLSWLDPGVFGTLGVGGGFAAGAALARPNKEVWLIYGDGSAAYSLAEFDTFCRHKLAPIAVIGNDGCWSQIAREQVEMLGDDVGTVLERSPYHRVAEGYGGVGILLDDASQIDAVLDEAKALSKQGKPVCINVHIDKTDFRKGSISV